jgi:hypothetical protein
MRKKASNISVIIKNCGTGFIAAYEIHKASSNAITDTQIN